MRLALTLSFLLPHVHTIAYMREYHDLAWRFEQIYTFLAR
jgi:hypothetical protein